MRKGGRERQFEGYSNDTDHGKNDDFLTRHSNFYSVTIFTGSIAGQISDHG